MCATVEGRCLEYLVCITLTVGQNNFGNKIPLKSRELLQFQQKTESGTTVFYQWITFVLAIHAAMLRFPYMIWKAQEDGYMKSFYADGQGKSIENKVRIFYKTYKLNSLRRVEFFFRA